MIPSLHIEYLRNVCFLKIIDFYNFVYHTVSGLPILLKTNLYCRIRENLMCKGE